MSSKRQTDSTSPDKAATGWHYEIKLVDKTSAKDSVVRIWKDNLGHASPEDKYNWYYINNPSGGGQIFLLCDTNTDQAVGVSCIGMSMWQTDDKLIETGILADLAVDQNHRSLGPAMKLSKSAYEHAQTIPTVLYGFPNKKAQPVIKRIGYQKLTQIARFARVLKTESYIKNRVPSYLVSLTALVADTVLAGFDSMMAMLKSPGHGHLATVFDERVDRLWDRVNKKGRFIAKRTHETLNWRHFEDPAKLDKKVFLLEDRSGDIIGYVVYHINKERAAAISDLLALNETVMQSLLQAFFVAMRKEGAHSVSLEFHGSDKEFAILHRLLFRAREDRPIFYLISTALPEETQTQIRSASWYITSADEDS